MSKTKGNPIHSARSALKNKRALSYIEWVCVILFFIILMAFVLSFVTAIDTIEGSRASIKHILDSFVDEHSIEIYELVKQNEAYEQANIKWMAVALKEVSNEVQRELDLVQINSSMVKMDEDGNPLYYIEAIQLNSNKAPNYGSVDNITVIITLQYTIKVPVRFMGSNVVWADIPLTIESEYTPKFD